MDTIIEPPSTDNALARLVAARLADAATATDLAVPAGLAGRVLSAICDRDDPVAALAALHLADLVVAQACAAGEPRALAMFERELAKLPAVLARHPARSESDEVTQRLRERLLVRRPDGAGHIASYTGRGSLTAWLRVAALRIASNLRRGQRPTSELTEAQALLSASPDTALLHQRYGDVAQAALRDAFRALAPDERTVLRLHYVEGLTVDRLVPLLGASRATAGRRLVAARTRLAELTIELLAARTNAAPAALRSVLRSLVSQLDVSLRGLMAE